MENDEQLGKFLVALWFIWEQRNSQFWNKRKLEEGEIIPRALGWLQEYLDMQEVGSEANRQGGGKWRPSQSTDFTISVDAGCLTKQGTGLGVVIRKKDGGFVAAGVRRTRRQWEALEAEVMVVKFGLEMAHRLQLHSIAIQTDCQQVERLITGQAISHVEVGQITHEIKEMGRTFQQIE
ncbi:unnamed protein product [Linum trigynum]|uniref:RNase H type-1 domain-containing protein n=1 Tax=Linum trigynum TaxID=586398 RepID=A0AAV2CH00_9ROSI